MPCGCSRPAPDAPSPRANITIWAAAALRHGRKCRPEPCIAARIADRAIKPAVGRRPRSPRKHLNSCDFAITARWPAGCRRQAGPSRFQGFASVEYVEYCARFTCCGFAHLAVANAGISSNQDTDSQPFAALLDAATSAPPAPPPAPAKRSRSDASSTHPPSPQPAQQPSAPTSGATGDSGTSDTGSGQTSGAQNQGSQRSVRQPDSG